MNSVFEENDPSSKGNLTTKLNYKYLLLRDSRILFNEESLLSVKKIRTFLRLNLYKVQKKKKTFEKNI